jgi:hypothetical protein
VPALATLAALWLAERGRFAYAYIFIAAGVLLKLYPAFLIPVIVIEQWRQTDAADRAEEVTGPIVQAADRQRGDLWRAVRQFWQRAATLRALRGVSLCFGLILGCFALSLVLNPAGTLSGFQYAGNRPLQVESTPASILWLGSIFGIPAYPSYSFLSLNYVGPLDSILKPASAVALVCGCLWVYIRQAQGKLTIGQAFLACLGIVLVTNKIFSPQYLIWIIPIVAYVEGLDLFWLAICFLTWYDYPILYQLHHPIQTVTYGWQFMPVLALRNGLLLYVTLRVILRPGSRLYHSKGVSADHGALAGRAGTGTDREEGGGIEHALAR